jgi:3-hydroxyacyl-CoA dehydrogenase/enoyl-CoA hydratase/3-hydroxybutyryl-CoA epimerase
MKTIHYALFDGLATVTFDEPNSPVNTMCADWQADMTALAAKLVADKAQLKGVLLTSAKSTFFAGANLPAVMRLKASDAPAAFAEIELLKKNMRTIETLGVPVVALINGAALGGGWEVALMAHYRIALANPKIQLGTPEVSLGLIPGATGLTKAVRLLGLMGANPYIVEGKLFNPQEGKAIGFIHDLADTPEQMREMALEFIAENPQCQQPWDVKGYKIPGGTPSNPKIAMGLTVAPAMLAQKTRGNYPAVEAAMNAMVEGAQVDYDTATRIESRYLAKLMTGQNAKNMITAFFFNLNAIKGGQSRPKDIPKWKPAKVGILGAGMMGAGIAWANASRGIASVLKDVSAQKADLGKAYSQKLSAARVAKQKMTLPAQAELLNLITPTASAADLAGCDLIIEAVFEQRALKAQVTQEAEPMLAPGGVMASNTSTLPITGLATASARPEKFVGLHFFSPVDKMKLVEIIRGAKTDDETIARAYDYVLAIGKTPIVVNDSRGFFTSRVFGTFVMEGAAMLAEGIPAAVVEQAGLRAGMPVGPLAVIDETSLSLSVHVMDQTRADFAAEGKDYTPGTGELLIERMVKELGRKGRAAGGGFYDYPEGGKKVLWLELKRLFEKPGTPWDMAELRDRILYRQAVETARCLAEGVLTSTHDANIGSIFGIGFPPYTGGAMQFVYSIGQQDDGSAFVARANALAAAHGPRFAVTAEVAAAIQAYAPRF